MFSFFKSNARLTCVANEPLGYDIKRDTTHLPRHAIIPAAARCRC